MVQIKEGKKQPRCVIDVKGIEEVGRLTLSRDELSIGALTSIRALETSSPVLEKVPLLGQAAAKLGSVQIRHRATIGGNLCNASPAADTAPPLLVMDAEVSILGPTGSRVVPLKDFFLGPGKTVLSKSEILTEVRIPPFKGKTGTAFIRLSRASMDIAKISIAVLLQFEGEKVTSAKIALGSVAPTPILADRAAQILIGKNLTKETIASAAETVADEIRPITDIRGTAEYRKEVSHVIAQDALEVARRRAKEN